MISAKKENYLIEKMLSQSIMIDNTKEQKNDPSSIYIEEIIHFIYPDRVNALPLAESDAIFIWVSDRSAITSKMRNIAEWKNDKRNVHIINSTSEIIGMSGVNEYCINEETEGCLALGYLNSILNVERYMPFFIESTDQTFIAFKQSLRHYSADRVSRVSGLNEEMIIKLYKNIRCSSQSYHLLALNSRLTECAIQTARSICLIPSVDVNFGEASSVPILFYSSVIENEFGMKINQQDQWGVISKKIDYSYVGSKSSLLFNEEKQRRVLFYDWDFADYFDVDPLPSIKNMCESI
ncbi:hypothetical protein ACM26V_12650 [Salipaludibacillus sp. HK11]|uniref:hypothetical protein n=1 Tax=Salipaludibacillus sp. HK11 TaxID=3394320 RepID=UPI0039FDC0C3